MKTYRKFLAESNVKQLKHLVHIEEAILHLGFSGARESIEILRSLRDTLAGNAKSENNISEKFDGCVHRDTLVVTEDGSVPIGDIVDFSMHTKVATYDFVLNSNQYSPILNRNSKDGPKTWIQVNLENNSSIKLTEDHELYTLNRGWVKAKDLNEGDDIKEM